MGTLWEMRDLDINRSTVDDGFYWSQKSFQIAFSGGVKSIEAEPVWTLNDEDFLFFKECLQIQLTQKRSEFKFHHHPRNERNSVRNRKKSLKKRLSEEQESSESAASVSRNSSIDSDSEVGGYRVLYDDEDNVRLYECPTCFKTFKLYYNLKVHKRVHTDFRPYKCLLCDRRCKQMGHIKKHMAQVHPNQCQKYTYEKEAVMADEPMQHLVTNKHYVGEKGRPRKSSNSSPRKKSSKNQKVLPAIRPCSIIVKRCDSHPLLLKTLSRRLSTSKVNGHIPRRIKKTNPITEKNRFHELPTFNNSQSRLNRMMLKLKLKYQGNRTCPNEFINVSKTVNQVKRRKTSQLPPSNDATCNGGVVITLFRCKLCHKLSRSKQEHMDHVMIHKDTSLAITTPPPEIKNQGQTGQCAIVNPPPVKNAPEEKGIFTDTKILAPAVVNSSLNPALAVMNI